MQEGTLRVVEGFMSKKLYVLPQDGSVYTLGRDRRRKIPIMSRRVSRDHAEIRFNNGTFIINDLGSKTGTQVNDKKIKSTVLRHNDLIRIGEVLFRFLMEEANEERKPVFESLVVLPPKPAEKPPPVPEKESLPKEIAVPAFSEEERRILGTAVDGLKIIATLTKGRRTLIYKATQAVRNRVVAFKMLQPEFLKDSAVTQWFVNGTRKAAELRHEDTITPLGGGRQGDVLYSFIAFMENGNALEAFANAGSGGLASVKRALEALVHISRALEYAQTKNVLHLGVRPTKILFNEGRQAKLIGLGFDNSPSAPGAETTLEVGAYLAPEQVTGSAEVSRATDIFSLGATFYYMLTGLRPPRDHRQRIPSPKQQNRLVPDSICRIIEKMLMPDPERRYTAYGQLIHDVRWALRGEAWPHA